MHPERSLDHVQRAFAEGSLADGVVRALAKFAADQQLSAQDLAALEGAKAFLQNARKGYGWLDRPEITEESGSLVSSFETAARSWEPDVSPGLFVAQLDEMLNTLSGLLEGNRPTKESTQSLRRFFGRVLRSANEQMDEVFSQQQTIEMGRWAQATPST